MTIHRVQFVESSFPPCKMLRKFEGIKPAKQFSAGTPTLQRRKQFLAAVERSENDVNAFQPTVLSTVALMLQCCVCLSVVCRRRRL